MAAGPAPALQPDPGAALRSRRARLLLVLVVAFGLLILSSTVTAVTGRHGTPSVGRVIYLLGLEAVSLLVLWKVLEEHPAGWQGLRLDGGWTVLPVSLGLAVGGWCAYAVTFIFVDIVAAMVTGAPYRPARPVTVLDVGLNGWTLALVLVNPFFEELIARGFVIREVEALTGNLSKAIVASVLVQVAYHTYQGPLLAVSLAANFLVWSLYYARTRRILPVILAHLYLDAFALLSRAHLLQHPSILK